MYESRKICNYILTRYDSRRYDLTNLRLNKLLFFIHAASLKSKPDGLVRNHFEAWQHGPVVRPVFDSFKIHGNDYITRLAHFLDYASGTEAPIPFDDIAKSDADIIDREFEEYSRFSTGQLVALSHEPGGPWDLVYRACLADRTKSPRIPNELIRSHVAGELRTARH